MNRWLTWRARLAHLLDPQSECLCRVCAQARVTHAIVYAEIRPFLPSNIGISPRKDRS